MNGKRLWSPSDLMQAVEDRRSVWYYSWGRPLPAAVIVNMPFRSVALLLDGGLYLWERQTPIRTKCKPGYLRRLKKEM